MPKLISGQASSAAMITPTSMPTIPHSTATSANARTTVSLYSGGLIVALICIDPSFDDFMIDQTLNVGIVRVGLGAEFD